MIKPYSQNLRDRVVRAVLAGQSRRKAARSFSASCVITNAAVGDNRQLSTAQVWRP
jgi:transposase